MDDLAIVIKTKIELDEKQARAELDSLSKNLSGDNSAAKIKIKIGVDEKASKANIKAAIPSLTNSVSNKPIKIAFDVDKATSLKNIKAGIADIQKKIKNSKLKIDLDIGDVSGSAKGGGKSKKSTVPGVRYGNIKGSKKYADALRAQVDNYTKAFQDKGATLSDINVSYDPVKKMHSAVVKYQNEVGQTTSMVFKLKEGWEQVKVVQTRVHNNLRDHNKELERSKTYLASQKDAIEDLKSKAFNQKNPLSGDHAADAGRAMYAWKKAYNEIAKSQSIVTEEQKRNLATLESAARRSYKEQYDKQWGATDFASKDVSKERKLAKTNLDARIAELKEMGLYVGTVADGFTQLESRINSINDIDALQAFRADLKQAEADLESFLSSFKGQALATANGIGGNQLSQIDTLLANPTIKSKQTTGVTSLRNELQELHNSYTALIDKMKAGDLTEAGFAQCEAELKELDIRLKSAANSAKIFDGSFKQNQNLEKAQQTIQKLRDQLENFKINTSAMQFPELRAEIERLEVALEGIDEVNVSNIQRQMTALGASIRATGANAKSFSAQIKDIFNEFKAYFSLADIVMTMARAFGDMAENVKAVNTAMTELKKVQDFTAASQDAFMKSAGQGAKDIGTEMSSYIEGVADFKKLGESLEDSIILSEAGNVLHVVGDGFSNISESTDAMIASMKAYGIEINNVMHIVDALNKVSNETSIETAGLADAITRSASSLAMGGLSFEKSLALIVAGNETVRNASVVGNGLKTMALRIMGAETALSDMGEEVDDYVKSSSKMREEIKLLTGVDIMIDDANFKDIYQIMQELSVATRELEQVDRNNVNEILFGKRQANIGASIFQNFDQAEKALKAAQNSAGSAMTEHARWMESIEASEARATAAYEQFSNTVLSSDLIKAGYDAQTGILGLLTNIIDKLGAIPTLAGAAAAALSFKGAGISSEYAPPHLYGAVA